MDQILPTYIVHFGGKGPGQAMPKMTAVYNKGGGGKGVGGKGLYAYEEEYDEHGYSEEEEYDGYDEEYY